MHLVELCWGQTSFSYSKFRLWEVGLSGSFWMYIAGTVSSPSWAHASECLHALLTTAICLSQITDYRLNEVNGIAELGESSLVTSLERWFLWIYLIYWLPLALLYISRPYSCRPENFRLVASRSAFTGPIATRTDILVTTRPAVFRLVASRPAFSGLVASRPSVFMLDNSGACFLSASSL
jgi:hypothetical protein